MSTPAPAIPATITVIHRPSTATDTHLHTLLRHCKVVPSSATLLSCLDYLPSETFAQIVETQLIPRAIKNSTNSKYLIVDGVAHVLGMRGETVGGVMAGLESLVAACGSKFDSIVLINHTHISTHHRTLFSFKDVLDTIAGQVFTIEEEGGVVGEVGVWQDGWMVVDAFVLRSSGTGTYGRIRKGSVKERIAVRCVDGKIQTRLVSDLVSELKPDASIVVSAAAAAVAPAGVAAPPAAAAAGVVSKPLPVTDLQQRNDPTFNLSFNLRLTDEQRSMKEAAVLPYVHTGEGVGGGNGVDSGGFIHYEADDFDDDEDADDDLAL
ncbi:hypothetical protein HDU98_002707 [Podochytrium sp. JEL0797]|nr:hypothetical protein HDU98_002707 [Podochytrium sp. JEL0797]